MLVYPKSVIRIDNLTVFFTLLGSVHVKAVHRMLMKLSPKRLDTRTGVLNTVSTTYISST